MDYPRMPELDAKNMASADSGSGGAAQELERQRLERSRKTVLVGWTISMVGIVLYCLVVSSGDPQDDLVVALGARGGLGWGAIIVILIGIGFWLNGCIGFMKDLGTD